MTSPLLSWGRVGFILTSQVTFRPLLCYRRHPPPSGGGPAMTFHLILHGTAWGVTGGIRPHPVCPRLLQGGGIPCWGWITLSAAGPAPLLIPSSGVRPRHPSSSILLASPSLSNPQGLGGGGTASLKVGTHCQTTAHAFFWVRGGGGVVHPLVFFFEGHRAPTSGIRHCQYKSIHKSDPDSSTKFSTLWISWISQNRVKTNTLCVTALIMVLVQSWLPPPPHPPTQSDTHLSLLQKELTTP